MYKIFIRKSVQKDFRKLAQELQQKIKEIYFIQITKAPFKNKTLSGKLRSLKSLSFKYKRTEYRIVYQVIKQDKVVLIVMLGTRENFYKKLENRLK